jgi:ABC-type transporter Mla subunit MlaD
MPGGAGGQVARLRREWAEYSRRVNEAIREIRKVQSDHGRRLNALLNKSDDLLDRQREIDRQLRDQQNIVDDNARLVQRFTNKVETLEDWYQDLSNRIDAIEAEDELFEIPEEDLAL